MGKSRGFSLHAGASAKGSNRQKIESLAGYVSRPPVAAQRVALTDWVLIRYALSSKRRAREISRAGAKGGPRRPAITARVCWRTIEKVKRLR